MRTANFMTARPATGVARTIQTALAPLRAARARFDRRMEERRAVADILAMNDHILQDIGLTRAEALRRVRGGAESET